MAGPFPFHLLRPPPFPLLFFSFFSDSLSLVTVSMLSTSAAATSNSKITKIVNARLLLDHGIVQDSYLWFQHGKIIHPQNLFFDQHRDADEVIDAEGALVVPGYLDIQINGGYGIDFADNEGSLEKIQADIDTVAKGLLQYGCTAFCPTVVSSAPEVYNKVITIVRMGWRRYRLTV